MINKEKNNAEKDIRDIRRATQRDSDQVWNTEILSPRTLGLDGLIVVLHHNRSVANSTAETNTIITDAPTPDIGVRSKRRHDPAPALN